MVEQLALLSSLLKLVWPDLNTCYPELLGIILEALSGMASRTSGFLCAFSEHYYLNH